MFPYTGRISQAPDSTASIIAAATGVFCDSQYLRSTPYWRPPRLRLLLQSYGRALWGDAFEMGISIGDACLAVEFGTADLDHGFVVDLCQRASRVERSYLQAMSQDGEGPSTRADWVDGAELRSR